MRRILGVLLACLLVRCGGPKDKDRERNGGVDTTTTDTLTCEIDWMDSCIIDLSKFEKEIIKVSRRIQKIIEDTFAIKDDTLICILYPLYIGEHGDTVWSLDPYKDEWYLYLINHRNKDHSGNLLQDTAVLYICGVRYIRLIKKDTFEGKDIITLDTCILGLTAIPEGEKNDVSSVAVKENENYAFWNVLDTFSLITHTCAHEIGAQFTKYTHPFDYENICIMVEFPRYEAEEECNIIIDSVFCNFCIDSLKNVTP